MLAALAPSLSVHGVTSHWGPSVSRERRQKPAGGGGVLSQQNTGGEWRNNGEEAFLIQLVITIGICPFI